MNKYQRIADNARRRAEKKQLHIALNRLKRSTEDTDRASIAILGDSLATATGCVVVLKGNSETKWLHSLLVNQSLLTPGKPIAPGMPVHS